MKLRHHLSGLRILATFTLWITFPFLGLCAETGGERYREEQEQLRAPAHPSDAEVVVIDNVQYPVPQPWAGHKLVIPPDTHPNLQMIPLDLTLNRTEIYLRSEAIEPLKAMAAAAQKDGITLLVDSGYRSARYQRTIFRQFLHKGQSFRNIARFIAPPGYSEHALGTVIDLNPSSHGFSRSPAYQWLQNHAGVYGFYEALPRHSRDKTPWEPWHWKFRLDPRPNTPETADEHLGSSPTPAPSPVATATSTFEKPPPVRIPDH